MQNVTRLYREPLNNNRFIVKIGNYEIGFSSISDIELTNQNVQVQEMKYIQNNVTRCKYVNMISNSKKKHTNNTVKLEKALMSYMYNSEQLFLLSLIKQNVNIECISVEILRNNGSHAAELIFTDCKLKSFHISELSATESSYIKQALVFYYANVTLVPQKS